MHPQLFVLRIAAKPLHIATWLLFTCIRNDQRPIQPYHRRYTTDTCSAKIGVPTANPKICVAHYGQTVSAELLLLTNYRDLTMLYLTYPFPRLTAIA